MSLSHCGFNLICEVGYTFAPHGCMVVYLHHVGGLSLQVETPTFSCLGDRWAFTSLCGDLRLGSVANSHPVLFEMLRVSVTSVAGQKI